MLVVLIIVGIWWKVSAHKYFTGQVRQVDIEEALHERRRRPAGRDDPRRRRASPGRPPAGA